MRGNLRDSLFKLDQLPSGELMTGQDLFAVDWCIEMPSANTSSSGEYVDPAAALVKTV